MAENIPIRPRRNRPAPPIVPVEIPPAPAHLSPEAREKWDRIVGAWLISDADLMILQGALEAWDLYQRCRAEVDRDGATFRTPSGMIRQHPAAKLSLDALGAFRQSMRQLGLEPEG